MYFKLPYFKLSYLELTASRRRSLGEQEVHNDSELCIIVVT